MSGKRLPRELRYTINRLAHERAQIAGGSFIYGRRYAEEKARLQGMVVTWIAAGSTTAEALARLQGGPDSRASKMRETLKALQRQIKEMP
jgi:hypothetical protein